MKLLVDARNMRTNRTGIGYYTESMLRAMDPLLAPGEAQALSLEPQAWDPPLRNISLRPTRIDYESHPAGEIYENLWLPRLVRRERIELFWGTAFLIPWARTSCARVVTIHDLTVYTHPQDYPKRFACYMRYVIRHSLGSADVVVCISTTTAEELRRLFPRLRARVEIVPAAADPFFCTNDGQERSVPPAVPLPYLLVVGAGDPRKNTALALRLFERLVRTTKLPHALVVLGHEQSVPPSPRVYALPRQERSVLRSFYRNAELLLLPSTYEGFGLPMLEAMACGCPVLASHAGALPEVGASAACYFDLTDENQAFEKLVELLESSQRLQRMRQLGSERAGQFSWHNSAHQLLHLFRETASRSRHGI